MVSSVHDRMEWMDILRGIAVVLIIAAHIPTHVVAGGVPPERLDGIRPVLDALAPIRVPVLFVLSGLLLERSLRKPAGQYVRGKLRAILYPFAVWVLLEGARRVTTGEAPLETLVHLVLNSYLWFLAYIFVYYLLALLLRRVPPVVVVGAFLAGAVVLPDEFLRGPYYGAFFFLGWYAVRYLPQLLALLRSGWFPLLAVAAIGQYVLLWGAELGAVTPLVQWLRAIPLIAVAAGLALRLERTRAGRIAAWYGTSSIVVYVSHYFYEGLIATHLTTPQMPPWLQFVLIGSGAFALVTLTVQLQRTTWVRYLFTPPRRPESGFRPVDAGAR